METKTKQIGKYSYTCAPLTGKKTIKVFTRLCNVLGPVVKGVDMAAAMSQDEEQMAASFMTGVSEALIHVKEEDLEYLTDMFAPNCTVQIEAGKNPLVSHLGEAYWGGQVPFTDWFGWILFCVTTNYADFLGEKSGTFLTALGLRKKDPLASKSQEASIGTAGDSS